MFKRELELELERLNERVGFINQSLKTISVRLDKLQAILCKHEGAGDYLKEFSNARKCNLFSKYCYICNTRITISAEEYYEHELNIKKDTAEKSGKEFEELASEAKEAVTLNERLEDDGK